MYMMTGTLNMADLAQRIKTVEDTRTILMAFAFLSIGIMLKIALFPMHAWLPNAYSYAPSLVTAFIAATSTKVSLYVFLRFVFTIFGAEYAFGTLHFNDVLLPLALLVVLHRPWQSIRPISSACSPIRHCPGRIYRAGY